jgi:hypothetical protein
MNASQKYDIQPFCRSLILISLIILSGDFSAPDAIDNWDIMSLVAQVEPAGFPLNHSLETVVRAEGELIDMLKLDARADQSIDYV